MMFALNLTTLPLTVTRLPAKSPGADTRLAMAMPPLGGAMAFTASPPAAEVCGDLGVAAAPPWGFAIWEGAGALPSSLRISPVK